MPAVRLALMPVLVAVLVASACSAGGDNAATSVVPLAATASTTTSTTAPSAKVPATTSAITPAAPDTTAASPTLTPTTIAAPTTTAEPESPYGPGGLVADLEGWADVDLPRFIIASHIDVADVEYVSRFRSAAGHDFSDSFEGPSSMKHYYRPLDYYGSRFTQSIYSPVDGVVLYLVPPFGPESKEWRAIYEEATGQEAPPDHRDWNIFIRPDDAPNVWIQHQHVNPLDEIVAVVPVANGQAMMLGVERPASPGYRVEAGDLIGYGLGEIIVARRIEGSGVPSQCNFASAREQWGLMPGCADKRQFHSIFEFMTDEVFAQYEVLVDLTREDFIITAEERAANPLVVDGESFVDEGILEDPEAYVRLQEGPATVGLDQPEPEEPQAEVAEALPGFTDLAAGRSVIAEFGASGTHTLEGFEAAGQFLLVISADAGPVGLMIDEGDGPRQVYGGPPGSEISTYETGWMGGGTITVSVEAPAEANWRLVAIASP